LPQPHHVHDAAAPRIERTARPPLPETGRVSASHRCARRSLCYQSLQVYHPAPRARAPSIETSPSASHRPLSHCRDGSSKDRQTAGPPAAHRLVPDKVSHGKSPKVRRVRSAGTQAHDYVRGRGAQSAKEPSRTSPPSASPAHPSTSLVALPPSYLTSHLFRLGPPHRTAPSAAAAAHPRRAMADSITTPVKVVLLDIGE
jgi:hypothetical protein